MGEDDRFSAYRTASEAQAWRGAFDAAQPPATSGTASGDGLRKFFALAAEAARVQFDPADEWSAFVRALWEQVEAGFGLSTDHEDYPGVPRAWFDEPDDPNVVVWGPRPEVG